VAEACLVAAAELGDYYTSLGHAALAMTHLFGNESKAAWEVFETAAKLGGVHPASAGMYVFAALAPLACGDLGAAQRWADDILAATVGAYRSVAHATRAWVAIAAGELNQAEKDAFDALALASAVGTRLALPGTLECLAVLATKAEGHLEAARLFGAADALRTRTGEVMFPTLEPFHRAAVESLRDVMGDNEFDAACAEGAEMSADEAIAYAQRGRGERKRPSSGWASLTPTELDVVRLVAEGLTTKAVAAKLFVSPRTVDTHLSHVYAKLGVTSRVQLVTEAARHA
jgi:DNA-binding CsgD family transcriptional regulator